MDVELGSREMPMNYDLFMATMQQIGIAKLRLGKRIVICSDGTKEKWELVRCLCENHVGYDGGFRLGDV